MELDQSQLETLRAYAAGEICTRRALERAGLRDYADLVIAMARTDYDFPKPANTPARQSNIARAREILQPRLRRGC